MLYYHTASILFYSGCYLGSCWWDYRKKQRAGCCFGQSFSCLGLPQGLPPGPGRHQVGLWDGIPRGAPFQTPREEGQDSHVGKAVFRCSGRPIFYHFDINLIARWLGPTWIMARNNVISGRLVHAPEEIVIFATLGSILDSQLNWESCKIHLARWSHGVALFLQYPGHPPTHPATLPTANVWNLCAVSPP